MTKILLVEDELLVRELTYEDLTEAGFEVTAARDGDEALAILQSDAGYDLLFTDIRMPSQLDGWQLAAEARRLIPGLRVIYATGLTDGAGSLEPGEQLLQKPYRRETLFRMLEETGLSPQR